VRHARNLVLLVLFVVGGAFAPGCTVRQRSGRPDLVLIVIDTVRPDHLSVYGHNKPTSPFLEEMARSGTVYDYAFSTSTWTLPAHASMFTGLLPVDHGADQDTLALQAGFPQLATLLDGAGYQTSCFTNNPWIAQDTHLSGGFDVYDALWDKPRLDGPWYHRISATVKDIREWFANKRDPDRPYFVFVNLMEAHGPYTPTWRQAKTIFSSKDAFKRARRWAHSIGPLGLTPEWYLNPGQFNAEIFQAERDLYDAEIRQDDAIVREVVREVDAVSDPAATSVLVVSDHGQNFGDHEQVGHVFALYQSTLRVAFLARGPGFVAGRRSNRPVQLVDVFPTLLGAAGVAVPDDRTGFDLRMGDPPASRVIRASYAYPQQVLATFPLRARRMTSIKKYKRALRVAVIEGEKLIRGSDGSEEYYDLFHDPDEKVQLNDIPAERRWALEAAAGGFDREGRDIGERPDAVLRPETRQALRALGYVQ
jgi:arylsulfatase A-like enzyme